METNFSDVSSALASNSDIPVGSSVIYALHGRCTVTAIETRELAGSSQRFYKLEVQKSALSRSNRFEPAIWVPVSTAKSRGIRAPMTSTDVDKAFEVLASREYYLPLTDAWHVSQAKVEALVRNEGSIGIAKALGFLFALKKKQVVPSPEVNRLNETLQRQFSKEVAELTAETLKAVDDRIARALKNKMSADS